MTVTTGEKYRDVDTHTTYNMFYVDHKHVREYLAKESTLEELKKNGSIGPFACNAQEYKLKRESIYGPVELCRTMITRAGNIVIGEPVLTKAEYEDIKNLTVKQNRVINKISQH